MKDLFWTIFWLGIIWVFTDPELRGALRETVIHIVERLGNG